MRVQKKNRGTYQYWVIGLAASEPQKRYTPGLPAPPSHPDCYLPGGWSAASRRPAPSAASPLPGLPPSNHPYPPHLVDGLQPAGATQRGQLHAQGCHRRKAGRPGIGLQEAECLLPAARGVVCTGG